MLRPSWARRRRCSRHNSASRRNRHQRNGTRVGLHEIDAENETNPCHQTEQILRKQSYVTLAKTLQHLLFPWQQTADKQRASFLRQTKVSQANGLTNVALVLSQRSYGHNGCETGIGLSYMHRPGQTQLIRKQCTTVDTRLEDCSPRVPWPSSTRKSHHHRLPTFVGECCFHPHLHL